MTTNIHFSEIKTREEFFTIFQGICNTAESAFNDFEKRITNGVSAEDAYRLCKDASYLMSITFVIMGMRGDYAGFNDHALLSMFSVEIEGVQYDQKYLYKMNDYFHDRFSKVLELLKQVNPETYLSYKTVWSNY